MKKYLMKFMALSFAALLSVCALAGCGGSADETQTTPPDEQAETINVPDDKQEQAPDVSVGNTEIKE